MVDYSIHELKIKKLEEVKRLTKEGILKWDCIQTDTRYKVKYNDYEFEVEFIRMLRTDEFGSDKMIASIKIIDLIDDYSIGTLGFDIIIETIAFSQPIWWPSWERGLERSSANLKKLQEIS
ncbi:hypothetical protein [Winogradskyella sp. 3972H.M.0a.05]|uniref:hypothetical protein n=1 Tax=Winogradskyella sp. 3972H.M.0a.05 TaxID=2950277 RepID=UPI00339B7127